MDPLYAAAIATCAAAAIAAWANVRIGRMNILKEKTKSAEDAAQQVIQKEHQVHEERLQFKDEQIAYWKSRFEACLEEQDHDG